MEAARRSPGAWRALLARLSAWITDLEYRARASRPFTYGAGSKRVFFPGCALTAADPALVLKSYEWLKQRDPSIALWSDCCGMPLEKFSTPAAAERGRDRTRRLLAQTGTTELVTACGNCTAQFGKLGGEGLKVTSLYALLAEEDWGPRARAVPAVVHHPCSARVDKGQQVHFKALAARLQLPLANADDPGHPLPCCLARGPSAQARRDALQGKQLVTYCAHCTVSFQRDVPTRHVLQETFGSEERWQPRGKLGRFLQYFRFARLAERRLGDGRAPARPGWKAPALVAAAAAVALLLVTHRAELAQQALALLEWSRAAGPLGGLLYGAAYVASTVLLLPGSALTLGAGYVWGPLWGVAIVSPVSVLAATASFLLGRTLARARVERRLGRDPRLAAIDRAVAEHGFRLVVLLRLSPVLPFNLLNYGLALTRVRLRDYVLGSALGMFPATVLFVYLGSLASSASELIGGRLPAGGAASLALTWAGLLATLAVVVLVTRTSRQALQRALAEQKP